MIMELAALRLSLGAQEALDRVGKFIGQLVMDSMAGGKLEIGAIGMISPHPLYIFRSHDPAARTVQQQRRTLQLQPIAAPVASQGLLGAGYPMRVETKTPAIVIFASAIQEMPIAT